MLIKIKKIRNKMQKNEIMLITGTRKGIGRYLAEYYAKKGYCVIGCSREKSDLNIKDYEHYIADVAKEDDIRDMIDGVSKKHGRLDIVINNAGIASMNHTLLTPLNTVRKIFDTNFVGTFLVCREGAKLMKRNNYGRIVNFGTVAVPLKLEGEAVYSASKSAIMVFTQILAKELAPFGITCNTVCPTIVDTDLIKSVPKDKLQRILDNQSIKRYAKPDDISNVIDFFIRKESNFITGQTIFLGGV